MTRKKVDLTYITNDSKRKATLKKRKNGLIKKVSEISTLCGIDACAIIYVPNDNQPEIWPSDEAEVRRVLTRFANVPELEQSKKMLNQESFLRQRIVKAQEQLKKQRNENKRKEMTLLMFQYLNYGKIFDNVSMVDLNDLSRVIEQNVKEIERKINRLSQDQEMTPVVENGGQNVNEGEQVPVNQFQGPLIPNLDAMQKQHWSADFINGAEMLPFGDVNAPNMLLPNPYVP